MTEQRTPRRVAWHGTEERDVDPRQRILRAAASSMGKFGVERTSISSIAREAGISRQTVYTYFANREEILREAVPSLAGELLQGVTERARDAGTAAEFIVELVAGGVEALLGSASIAPMIMLLDTEDGRRQAMSDEILVMARVLLEPISTYRPSSAPTLDLDLMAETTLRMTISLLTCPSERTSTPGGLRAYIEGTMVPAFGLEVTN
jgi:AcrR family transcriptional regulator